MKGIMGWVDVGEGKLFVVNITNKIKVNWMKLGVLQKNTPFFSKCSDSFPENTGVP